MSSRTPAPTLVELANAGKIRFQTQTGGSFDEQWPYDEWLEPESADHAALFEVWTQPVSGQVTIGSVQQWQSLNTARDWSVSCFH